jgi:outer membrane protein OmpA-like peptidoglycan-associated protein
MRSLFAAAVMSAVVTTACSTSPAPPTERPVREATACPDLAVTVYFAPGETTMPASADPVFATIDQTIRRCRSLYSPLKRVEISGNANRAVDGAAADAHAAARASAIKTRLVDLGVRDNRIAVLPHDDIEDDPNQPLRRHADVRITFGVER